MRICLYTETALPIVGGQELAIDSLARQFLAAGHIPTVLTLHPRRLDPAADKSLPYEVVRHRRYFSTRFFLRWYCSALDSLYRRQPFQILHCHNIYPAGYVAALWAAQRGIPLVLTSHACDIAPESHLLRKPHVPQRIRSVLQQAAGIVAISDFVAERFRILGAPIERIQLLPNGVDLASFLRTVPRPAALPTAIQPFRYFLFLGRLVPRKGADLLLEALRAISASLPSDSKLVIAGAGEQEPALRRRVVELGLEGRVHFPGIIAGEMKTYLLQHALSVVVPSRISEGSSLAVLESFAAGRPVIGTAIPGLKSAIEHEQTGLLVAEDSVPELAAALLHIATDPASANRWGAQAQKAVQSHDWATIAGQHLDLYSNLISQPARRQAA